MDNSVLLEWEALLPFQDDWCFQLHHQFLIMVCLFWIHDDLDLAWSSEEGWVRVKSTIRQCGQTAGASFHMPPLNLVGRSLASQKHLCHNPTRWHPANNYCCLIFQIALLFGGLEMIMMRLLVRVYW
jgi:hypothetical protein